MQLYFHTKPVVSHAQKCVLYTHVPYRICIQLKCMIQSSTKNSNIWADPTLRKPPLIYFGLIQFSTIPGMKHLSFLSQFILGQQRVIKNNIELSQWCSTLAFVRLSVTAVYQELHFWTRLWTEDHESLHFCFHPGIFRFWIHCNAWSNLTHNQFNSWNLCSNLWLDLT